MQKINNHSSTSVIWPVGALLLAVVTLALGTSYAKQLFPIIGAQGTSALRVGISALILLAIWRPWRWSLSKVDAKTILKFGLALGLMNLLFYMAIRTIPFGIAVAIEFTGPLTVAMYFSRRKTDYLWVFMAVLGLALILPLGNVDAQLDWVGVFYAIGAAICWGTYIVFGKRAGHLHAGQTVSLGVLAASFVVVPVGVVHAGAALLDPQILLAGVVVALVSSAIPISLEMFALKRLPRETFGVMASLEPAVAALAALAFLGEVLSFQQWLAIGCIVVASAGSVATLKFNKTQAAILE